MGTWGALFLTLSAETPASSVFVILPGVIQAAGSGALIAMAAAGLVALCMALTYAELGSAFPSAGGEYAIVGEVLGPVAGFAVLGVNLFNLLVACAALSLGVADYLQPLIPGAAPVAVALIALAAATGLGVLNIRASAMATGAFLAVELAALAVVTWLGLAHPARPLGALLTHPVALASGGHGLQAVGAGASPPGWWWASSPTTATAARSIWPRRCATSGAAWSAPSSGRSPSPPQPSSPRSPPSSPAPRT